jgi:carbon monoxide dehydrogenase subunit G
MAHYIARVRTDMPVEQAFAFMADVRNFEQWDPGVVRSVQVRGEGPSSDAVYDVTVDNAGREMTLRYEVTDHEPPNRVRIVGKATLLTSIDVIDVSDEGGQTTVVYDATLVLPFPLSLADKLLDKAFQKIGDRAAKGMERALEGTLVT